MTTQYSYYHKIKKEQKQKTNDKNSNSNVSNNLNNFNNIVDCNNTDNIVVARNTKPPERTIKSNRIIMKVKELRTWLKVAPPPPLFESDVVVAIVEKKKKDKEITSNIMERFYNIENIANESKELELESEYESFDLLGIESKSTASTSPSSTFVNVHNSNNKGETEEPISLSFDNYDELFGGGDEEIDNDDNNNESRPPTPSKLYEKKNDMDHVTGKNHLDLLYKQAPPIAVVVEVEQEDAIVKTTTTTTTTTTSSIIDSEDGRRVNVDDADDDEEKLVIEKLIFNNANLIGGTIPPEMMRLTDLTSLDLYTNRQLNGSIPSSIFKLINLEYLFVQDSGLSGLIPSEIGQLLRLRQFHFDNTHFVGTMPESICKLTEKGSEGRLDSVRGTCGTRLFETCSCCKHCKQPISSGATNHQSIVVSKLVEK